MTVYQIRKKIKYLGEKSNEMRWSNKLYSLHALDKIPKKPSEFLFEFWCYLCVASELSKSGVSLAINKPAGSTHAVWPMAPSDPENFSFFSFGLTGTKFGLYPGVNFTYSSCDSTFAPDVSIRSLKAFKGGPRIYAAWDAKFREKSESRITRSEVYTFAVAIQKMPIRISAKINTLLSGIVNPLFRSPGLLSNGLYSTESDITLSSLGCCETSRFGTSDQETRP